MVFNFVIHGGRLVVSVKLWSLGVLVALSGCVWKIAVSVKRRQGTFCYQLQCRVLA